LIESTGAGNCVENKMSNTSGINAINLQVRADDQIAIDKADGTYAQNFANDPKYYLWHGDLQTIPMAMNGEPVEFAQKLRTATPDVINTLRLPFNEYSFNSDGSLHPDYEAFLVEAVAQGFDIIFVYMGGDAQRLGRDGDLTQQELHDALDDNLGDISGAWTSMLDWLDDHPTVEEGTVGYELINEPAAYARGADLGGNDAASMAEFVGLYVDHVEALTNLIEARADGNIFVGGWGYSARFQELADTIIDGQSALDAIRTIVGDNLIWSGHIYPGWMGTDNPESPEELEALLSDIYSSVLADELMITEINALGSAVNDVSSDHPSYIFARTYEWFAENGVGAAWFPGAQAGQSALVTILLGGPPRYLHQDSLAHALNLFSLDENPTEWAGDDTVQADIGLARLVNEYIPGEPGRTTDIASRIGFGFGYGGNDTIYGDNPAGYPRDPDNPIYYISNDFLYGGTGDDTIYGGDADDFLFGQYGNDTLHVTSGTNMLFGGDGDDHLIGGTDIDQLEGGAGRDTFDLSQLGNDIVTDFDTGLAETIDFGGSFSDFYEFLANVVQVDFDNDGVIDDLQITHSNGDVTTILNLMLEDVAPGDFLLETTGIVDGTSGNDVININYIDGQGDSLGDGDDLVYLGAGDDSYYGTKGNDIIYGGNGDDLIIGWKGNNTIFGGAGNDHLVTGQNTTEIHGGIGDDIIDIYANKNNAHVISGGEGSDEFNVIYPSLTRKSESVILDFEIGVDSLVIDGITIDLVNGNAGITFTEIEGNLQVDFGDNDTVTLINVLLPTPNGYVDGTLGDDTIDYNYIDTGGEAVGDGNDIVYGWAGNDTINLARGNDVAFGGDGNDTIYGYKGNNTIYGEAGDDILYTGQHSSTLFGGAGDDVLNIDMHKNVSHSLDGGDGADTFVFTTGGTDRKGTATIDNFEIGIDHIQIEGVTIMSDLVFTDTAAGVIVGYNDDEEILLTGISSSELSSSELIF